ncbi:head completion/stabilization protein, partial [Cellvibrio mixtus]|uniref:head completion/stabilization protein n=1 Tax=Cellvibrio mixtus TaxID=39650 RepID=UPI0013648333
WVSQQQQKGIAALDDVPQKTGHPAGAIKNQYFTAVWSLAKAELVERLPDYDTTNAGKEKADTLEPSAETYRRDASWAINDIIGAARTTIELI